MSVIVISSIIAFTAVILLLVFILLFAQSKLVQSGDVTIVINDDKDNPVTTPAGWDLAHNLISTKKYFYHRHVEVVVLALCANARLTPVAVVFCQRKLVT